MKKKVLLLIALLLPLMVNAQICVDDIYYAETDDGNYKVTKNPDGYSGEITIPSTVNGRKVTEIDDRAFANNSKVTAIHLPITIEKIGVAAFCICENISTIEIPDKVNRIAEYAFGGNPNLCDVYCYSPQVVIGERLFYATKVKNITLHVPEANINYFKKADQWKKIKNIVPTTEESWAMKQQRREIAEQERLLAEARQKQIQDSIARAAAREKQIKDSIEAKQKIDAEIAAAENGDLEALYQMGERYMDGYGVAKDVNRAISYLKQASDSGLVKAQQYLGLIYYNGLGVEKNVNQAIPYLKKAADKGDSYAQAYLGSIYLNGEGVKKDEKIGMSWLNKSIAQGNGYAIDFKNKYQKEHESYWETEYSWRVVMPNGLTVARLKDRWVETNNFKIMLREEKVSKEKFNSIVNRKSKFEVNVKSGMYEREYQDIVVKESKLDYYKSLSDIKKNELLIKEMSVFLFKSKAIIRVFTRYIDNPLAFDYTYDGTFEKGKFVSKVSKLASLMKRFGFNPLEASNRQIFTPGRALTLIDDYSRFLVEMGESSYSFKLVKDNGISRLLRVFKGGRHIASMWVSGGKIDSVTWH